MVSRSSRLVFVLLAGALVLPALLLGPAGPAGAAEGFASPRFRTLWSRTDQLVEGQQVRRTWLWGPQPLGAFFESYAESPGGLRQVQYFDKSRMEIINPDTGQVTNGLLATELISGRQQMGNGAFEDREPAAVNVAGDPDDTAGPTYASLTSLLGRPPVAVGSPVTEILRRDGTTGDDPATTRYGVTAVNLVPETNHSIASVFWNYLQTTGPVLDGAQQRTERLFEPWYAAVGLPISRPYWARVKVAGTVQDVLIQAFQRRVLTYTPANPDGFKVEMGNIGRHYFRWRYGRDPQPALAAPSEYQPLTVPRLGFGFNGFFTFSATDPAQRGHLARSLSLVNEAGFGWIRQQVVWATLEPAPGQYDLEQLAIYDAIVQEASQRKLGIMFSVAKAPRWAVASDAGCHDGEVKLCGLPRDPALLGRLLAFLTNRYRAGSPLGRVQAWEVWNEQNTGGETGNNVDAGAYVELLKTSYLAIKGADPEAIVVFGGLTPTGVMDRRIAIDDVAYLEQIYQYNNGEVKRYFDVLGAHPGSNNNPPDALFPDQPGPGTGCPEADGKCWRDHPSFYFRRIEQLRAVMEKYGDGRYGDRLKQVWLTEFGWTTLNRARGYEYGSVISEELQARYLVRALEKGRDEYTWMGVMFLWTLNHSIVAPCEDEKYPWSVLYGGKCPEEIAAGRQTWDPRPAFLALKTMPKQPGTPVAPAGTAAPPTGTPDSRTPTSSPTSSPTINPISSPTPTATPTSTVTLTPTL